MTRLALIFNKDRPDTIGCYFESAARDMGIPFDHFWTSDPSIPHGYGLYLRIDHGDYKFDIPENLRPCAFYAIDTHLEKPYKKIKAQVLHYDHVFCAQKDGVRKLSFDTGKDAKWVPIGCDPQVHKDPGKTRNLDVAFVGTEGKKNLRGTLLKRMACRYPSSYIGRADWRLMSNIYGSAKIGFNYSIKNDINMRMFEVMSCGALLVTNRINDNGFEELFTDGRDLVVYDSPDDLFKKVDYYLSRDGEREKIALRGHELAVSRYSYRERLKTMLEECGWR